MPIETRRTLVIFMVLGLGLLALGYVVLDGRSVMPVVGLLAIAGFLLVWDVTKNDRDIVSIQESEQPDKQKKKQIPASAPDDMPGYTELTE